MAKAPGAAALTAAQQWGLAAGTVGASGFDPDILHTRATDANGHSDTKSLKELPPDLSARIAEAVGTYPEYKSISDVMRDAVVLGLYHRVQGMDDPVAKARIEAGLHLMTIAQTIEDDRVQLEFWKSTHDKLTAVLTDYERLGARDRMLGALLRFEEQFQDLTEEPFRSQNDALVATWRQKLASA